VADLVIPDCIRAALTHTEQQIDQYVTLGVSSQ
jgi:hypothetical protein